MKMYLAGLFVVLTGFGMVSCAAPYEDAYDDDDDDDGHAHAVTSERVGVDPYTGTTHSEVTTRVIRSDD